MKLYILVNPQAGHFVAEKLITHIQRDYSQIETSIFRTEGPDNEAVQVEAILRDFLPVEDRLLILGGDGTLSKTLTYWPSTYPFAYYPTGSGNDFARAMEISSLHSVIDSLLHGQTRDIYVLNTSLGTVLNSIDLGFAAQVIQDSTNSRLKKILNQLKLGKLTYLLFGIKNLFSKQAVNLTVRTDEISYKLENLFFFSVAKSGFFGGGIMIWPTASSDKKELDIVYFENRSLYERIKSLLALLLRKHEFSQTIQHLTASTVEIVADGELPVQLDGEINKTQHLKLTYQKRKIYL